jgi:hypothetical protein
VCRTGFYFCKSLEMDGWAFGWLVLFGVRPKKLAKSNIYLGTLFEPFFEGKDTGDKRYTSSASGCDHC